jgi:tetratricopeptide (TPR) repeat protein
MLSTSMEVAAKQGKEVLVLECLRDKGVVLEEMGKHLEAAKIYGMAADLDPTSPELVSARAFSLKAAGKYVKAAKHFMSAATMYERDGQHKHYVEECMREAEEVGLVALEARKAKAAEAAGRGSEEEEEEE